MTKHVPQKWHLTSPDVTFCKLQMHRKSLSPGLRPGPRCMGELYDAWSPCRPRLHTPRPRRLRRLDLGAYGSSIARPLPLKIPGYAYAVYNMQLRNIGKKHRLVCPTYPTEMYCSFSSRPKTVSRVIKVQFTGKNWYQKSLGVRWPPARPP